MYALSSIDRHWLLDYLQRINTIVLIKCFVAVLQWPWHGLSFIGVCACLFNEFRSLYRLTGLQKRIKKQFRNWSVKTPLRDLFSMLPGFERYKSILEIGVFSDVKWVFETKNSNLIFQSWKGIQLSFCDLSSLGSGTAVNRFRWDVVGILLFSTVSCLTNLKIFSTACYQTLHKSGSKLQCTW